MGFRALVRHFLRQFASFESVATGGEIKEAVVAILSLLAGPGLLVSMFAIRGGPRLALTHLLDGLDPLVWYWGEEWWAFRVTEATGSGDYMTALRAAALRAAVLPVLGLAFVAYVLLWGFGLALAHVAWALALALVTIEWLFFGFRKIPFTCSYQPGKARLRANWPTALLIAPVYCGALPELSAWALRRPAAWLVGLALLVAAWRGLASIHAWERQRRDALVFDDKPIPLLTRLGLED